ncbi:MAG: hypothetical protein PHZ02_00605 [Desulfocapsaceae bacterium]|nr:hypothetical protein [Desulfocapsaceae bacterium]
MTTAKNTSNTLENKPAQGKARLVMVIEHDPGQKVEETALIRVTRERGHQIICIKMSDDNSTMKENQND